MWWENPSHACEDTKKFRNLCGSNQPGHKIYLNMCLRNHLHPSVDSKRISTCVDQTYYMPAWTQNASQHVLTIHLPYQWKSPSENVLTKSYQASEGKKCIRTYVYQSPTMTARTRNAAQQVLTIPHPRQRQKNFISTCVNQYTPHASEEKKLISKCVDPTHPIPTRTQNVSRVLMNKPLPCQRGQKIYLN